MNEGPSPVGTTLALIGQCQCGASLTAYHVRYECPLTLQPSAPSLELIELVRSAFDAKYDTSHVAVLGEN